MAEAPTAAEVEELVEASWRYAHDVTVESVRVDSEGTFNAWTVWEADAPTDGGELVTEKLSMNIRLRYNDAGELKMI